MFQKIYHVLNENPSLNGIFWVRHGHPPGAAEALIAEPGRSRTGAELDPIRDSARLRGIITRNIARAKKVQETPAVRRMLGPRVVVMRLKRGAGQF